MPKGFRFFPSFKDHFLPRRPNPNLTIRSFFTAVPPAPAPAAASTVSRRRQDLSHRPSDSQRSEPTPQGAAMLTTRRVRALPPALLNTTKATSKTLPTGAEVLRHDWSFPSRENSWPGQPNGRQAAGGQTNTRAVRSPSTASNATAPGSQSTPVAGLPPHGRYGVCCLTTTEADEEAEAEAEAEDRGWFGLSAMRSHALSRAASSATTAARCSLKHAASNSQRPTAWLRRSPRLQIEPHEWRLSDAAGACVGYIG
jgi:hypothetical protein